jgi:hypothetical protein
VLRCARDTFLNLAPIRLAGTAGIDESESVIQTPSRVRAVQPI